MKRVVHYPITCGAILIFALVLSCSDSERRFPAFSKNMATVVISLGLPDEHAAAEKSILDRIFHFFVRDAVAQTAPATFDSISVNVTAAGMSAIQQSFNPSESMTLTVPAGAARQFDVIAHVDPDDPSAAQSFRGVTVIDLVAGDTVEVPVVMALYETKIVIPDYQNQRLVQINGFSINGWTENYYDTFSPTDIDFDARGNFYATSNLGIPGIFKYSSISEAINYSTPVITVSGRYPYALGIDRTRNIIYFSAAVVSGYMENHNYLYRSQYNGTSWNTPTLLTISGISNVADIKGIDVDQSSGDLFLACTYGSLTVMPAVVKINSSGVYMAHQDLGSTACGAYDVVLKSPYIYVAQYYFAMSMDSRNRIIQFDTDLTTQYKDARYFFRNSTLSDYLVGPRRFIATLNRRLYLIDEYEGDGTQRLIGFDGIDTSGYGAGWETFGSTGTGTGQFRFYHMC